MIDKIYKNNAESYNYVKNFNIGNSWDTTNKSSFSSVFANTADSFNLSDKTKMQNAYSDFLNSIGAEVNSENMQAVKSVQDRLSYFMNAGTSDVDMVAQLGADIGKSDDMTVYGEMLEKQEEKAADEDAVSTSIQEYCEKHPEVYNDIRLFKIAKSLFSNGMTVTDYNVDKLVSVSDMLSKVGSFSDSDVVNLLKSGGNVSAEDICYAKYTGGENNGILLSGEEIDELMPEVEKLFEREEIELNDENLSSARLFLENDIPVSKENIEKAAFLKNADFSDMFDSLANAEAKGEDCLKADLYEIGKVSKEAQKRLYENYIKVSDNIKNIDISVLQKMYENGTEYTLENISDMAESYISENLSSENDVFESFREAQTISSEAVSAKRKITEIQYMMTNEAMLRLSGKGIDITTEYIEDALEELKKTESEINAATLKSVGAEVNDENLEIMSRTFEVKNSLVNVSAMNIFENAVKSAALINFNYIADTFEALELAPSAKYGDTIAYTDEQVSNLLETNGFEATEENIKAAEIISRNEMDLTDENILAVKTINLKLEKVYDKLHPLTAAQMIKDGINPLETSLDDMLEYIDNYNEDYGQTSKEKIAEYIIEAENKGELTEEEKKAVTAVYRALNMAESYGSAAVGLTAESTSSVTVGKLLNAAKAFAKTKKGGFENVIDDNFGMLEGMETDDDNIQSTVLSAVSELNETESAVSEYVDLLIERLIDVAAPDELIAMMRENGAFSEEALENVYAGLKKLSAERSDLFISREKAEDLAEKVRNMNEGGVDAVKWLTENNIPLTVNNISSMAKLMADSFKSGSELNNLDKEEKSKGRKGIDALKAESIELEESSDFAEASEDISEEISEVYEDVVLMEQIGDIGGMFARLNELGIDIDLQKNINSSDSNAFQIPVRLSDNNITNLNMYVINDSIDGGSIKGFMNIDTENIGTVGAYITVKDLNVSVKIKSDSEEGANALSETESRLKEMFEEAGFENIAVEFYSDAKTENVFSNDFKNQVEENAPDLLSDINLLI